MNKQVENISVCICTYKRPQLLKKLLSSLTKQDTQGKFCYSIIVVDNDKDQSALNIVNIFNEKSSINIDYYQEEKINISHARNKALNNAKGKYIAIIDDDESPENNWLLKMYSTLIKFDADGVAGSVLPIFETDPADWIKKGKIFYWRDYKPQTGTKINVVATNNVIFKKELIDRYNHYFDPEFGITGGEDIMFFSLLVDKGHIFVSCREAVVYEYFQANRCTPEYIKKRSLLEGSIKARSLKKQKKYQRVILSLIKGCVALLLFFSCYPLIFMLAKKEKRSVYYFKLLNHISFILEIFSISIIKDRKEINI